MNKIIYTDPLYPCKTKYLPAHLFTVEGSGTRVCSMGHIGTLVDEFGIIGTYSLALCPQCFCMFSKLEAVFILFSEKNPFAVKMVSCFWYPCCILFMMKKRRNSGPLSDVNIQHWRKILHIESHMASQNSGEGRLIIKRGRKKRVNQNDHNATLNVSFSKY
jgi:hypothetical protein